MLCKNCFKLKKLMEKRIQRLKSTQNVQNRKKNIVFMSRNDMEKKLKSYKERVRLLAQSKVRNMKKIKVYLNLLLKPLFQILLIFP